MNRREWLTVVGWCDQCGGAAMNAGRVFYLSSALPPEVRPVEKYLVARRWRCGANGHHVGEIVEGGSDEKVRV